jgi:serine/threonine protein kinase
VSDEAKDLILSKFSTNDPMLTELLEKDRFKRISIEDVLSHPWVCKRSKNMLEARNNADLLTQFEAFSTTDYKNP